MLLTALASGVPARDSSGDLANSSHLTRFELLPQHRDVRPARPEDELAGNEAVRSGFDPALHHLGVAAAQEGLHEPYFALAEEADVPLLIHALGLGPELPSFRSAAGNPLLLEEVLARHPKLLPSARLAEPPARADPPGARP